LKKINSRYDLAASRLRFYFTDGWNSTEQLHASR